MRFEIIWLFPPDLDSIPHILYLSRQACYQISEKYTNKTGDNRMLHTKIYRGNQEIKILSLTQLIHHLIISVFFKKTCLHFSSSKLNL